MDYTTLTEYHAASADLLEEIKTIKALDLNSVFDETGDSHYAQLWRERDRVLRHLPMSEFFKVSTSSGICRNIRKAFGDESHVFNCMADADVERNLKVPFVLEEETVERTVNSFCFGLYQAESIKWERAGSSDDDFMRAIADRLYAAGLMDRLEDCREA